MNLSCYTAADGPIEFTVEWPTAEQKAYINGRWILQATPRLPHFIDCKMWRDDILSHLFTLDLEENGYLSVYPEKGIPYIEKDKKIT